jgi:signal transduction histidine kinase
MLLNLSRYKFIPLVCLFLPILSCKKSIQQNTNTEIKYDSISSWINTSKDKSLKKEVQISYLEKAYNKLREERTDSLKAINLSLIAYRYYELNDTTTFKMINNQAQEVALKINNSYVLGDSHWSYADFYFNLEKYKEAYYHFNKAFIFFDQIKMEYESARMLYLMAFIKARNRDYTGSEVLLIRAIKKFEKLKDYRRLYDSYNDLGILQNDMEDYDKALFYYEKAKRFIKKLNNKNRFYESIYTNLGVVHLKKENYLKAEENFKKSLSYNTTDIRSYARLIDHLAFCRLMLNDTTEVEKDMHRSLFLRDSVNNKAGVVYAKIRLSKYYSHVSDTSKAVLFAKEANLLAKEIDNGEDYLESLLLLSKFDKGNSNEYLNQYIRFNDSLDNVERKTYNKFARIEFETDEVIEQNRTLGQRMIWIISGSIALLIFLSLLYFIRVQKAKNEKLFLETEQQKANEQVYLLTLKQQATLEEERTKERNRISQELHDGILGRLFGTRVGLGFLDFEADEQTQEQHEAFLEELQDIEKEIREVSHKLNDNFTDPDVNFTNIVTQLLESKSQIGDFQFHLNIDENISWKQTDEIIKVNVYRIIQETLQNTIKHANAKNVTLDFSTSDSQLWVQIMDDGVGFNLKKSRKGIGLKNMKSRVEKLNGSLEIQSAVNKGTQIHIKIPLV